MNFAEIKEVIKTQFPMAIPAEIEQAIDFQSDNRFINYEGFARLYAGNVSYDKDSGHNIPNTRLPKQVVNKITTWLVGKTPVFRFPEANEFAMGSFLQEILDNSAPDIWVDARNKAGIYGDSYIQAVYSRTKSYGDGGVGLVVHNTEDVLPVYTKSLGEAKLISILVIQQVGGKLFLEVWTDYDIKVFMPDPTSGFMSITLSEDFLSAGEFVRDGVSPYFRVPNPYGFIPFVHVKNTKNPLSEYFGVSDLEGLIGLSEARERALENFEENVEENNEPTTIMQGVALKDVHRFYAERIFSNLPPDAKVYNLEAPANYPSIEKLLELLDKETGITAFPLSMLNMEKMLSDTSYSALQLFFLPLLEIVDFRKKTFGPAIAEIVGKGLRMQAYHKGLNLSNFDTIADEEKIDKDSRLSPGQREVLKMMRLRKYWYLEVEFQNYIPKNRTLELADVVVEVQNNLEAWSGALKRLGVENTVQKKEEIEADQERLSSLSPPPEGKTPQQKEAETGQTAGRSTQQSAMKGKGNL